jgi:hypothetical protein
MISFRRHGDDDKDITYRPRSVSSLLIRLSAILMCYEDKAWIGATRRWSRSVGCDAGYVLSQLLEGSKCDSVDVLFRCYA